MHTELISCASMRHRGGGGGGTIDSRHRNGGKVYSKRRRITPINYEAARRGAEEGERIERERGGVENVSFVGEERSVVVVVASTPDCGEGIHAKLFRRVERRSFVIVNRVRRNEYEVSTEEKESLRGILLIKFSII